jgi:hypothetical protein
MREANSDAELDARIYELGDFQEIMNVAKRTSYETAPTSAPLDAVFPRGKTNSITVQRDRG